MRLAITGADGFVGRAVTARLRASAFAGEVRLIDRQIAPHADWEALEIDLGDPGALDLALAGVDRVLHLAALPGAAAEADPHLSRKINLELPLDLIDRMAGRRLVYASSVAVFGDSFPARVDDDTAPLPSSVYGTHKRMAEMAFADAVRRKAVTGFALRLPGIVARPVSATGFGSAFLSDIFHAARDGRALVLPVLPDATSWLMSVDVCAENLLHALLGEGSDGDAITLGAVQVEIGALIASLERYGDMSRTEFREDAGIRRHFGSHSPLNARRAAHFGFIDDGSVDGLVDTVMQSASLHKETRNFA